MLVSATEPIATTIDDASQAAALRAWALLRPLGSLPSGASVGATSRAWFEELRLAPAVADALRGGGLDEARAWGAAERVRLLLDLPLPSTVGGKADGLPLRLVDVWLADPVVRSFLRINRWDDADWFNRESWLELVTWTDRLERALTLPEARRAAPGRAVRPRPSAGGGRRGVGLPRRRAARGVGVRRPGCVVACRRPDLAPAECHRSAARPEGCVSRHADARLQAQARLRQGWAAQRLTRGAATRTVRSAIHS